MSCDISSQEDLRSSEDQNISIENFTKENDARASTIYDEPKHTPKVVRVLTVIGYILAVSLAAIMLSLYYVLMWNPPNINRNYTSEIVSEALKQMKTEDAQSLVSAPTFDTDPVPSWQTTTEDSAESLFDEASSETKIDDNNIPMDNTILNYESDSVSNETIYK